MFSQELSASEHVLKIWMETRLQLVAFARIDTQETNSEHNESVQASLGLRNDL